MRNLFLRLEHIIREVNNALKSDEAIASFGIYCLIMIAIWGYTAAELWEFEPPGGWKFVAYMFCMFLGGMWVVFWILCYKQSDYTISTVLDFQMALAEYSNLALMTMFLMTIGLNALSSFEVSKYIFGWATWWEICFLFFSQAMTIYFVTELIGIDLLNIMTNNSKSNNNNNWNNSSGTDTVGFVPVHSLSNSNGWVHPRKLYLAMEMWQEAQDVVSRPTNVDTTNNVCNSNAAVARRRATSTSTSRDLAYLANATIIEMEHVGKVGTGRYNRLGRESSVESGSVTETDIETDSSSNSTASDGSSSDTNTSSSSSSSSSCSSVHGRNRSTSIHSHRARRNSNSKGSVYEQEWSSRGRNGYALDPWTESLSAATRSSHLDRTVTLKCGRCGGSIKDDVKDNATRNVDDSQNTRPLACPTANQCEDGKKLSQLTTSDVSTSELFASTMSGTQKSVEIEVVSVIE